MGKINSKEKGKVGEREAAELLRQYGFEARRGVQYQGGEDSQDLAHNIPGFHIEVKRTESLSVYQAVAQAMADNPFATPLVLHRRNRKEWLAILPASALLSLLSQAHHG